MSGTPVDRSSSASTTPSVPTPSAPPAEALGARLGGLPALAALTIACRQALAETGELRSFARKETILREGERASALFVLLSGRVKMVRTTAIGRDVIVALFERGEIFGAVGALGGEPCSATLVANQSCQCLVVERDALFSLLSSHVDLIGELLPILARQLVECRNCVVELSCYRVEVRFAHLFLRLAEKLGIPGERGTFVPIELSRRELADMTGTAIETAIRTMSAWEKSGLVTREAEGFRIGDPSALKDLALGSER